MASVKSSEGQVLLRVHGWHTECGACGYGSGGWANSPARQGKPVLTPHSDECPDCGAVFTHVEDCARYTGITPIADRDPMTELDAAMILSTEEAPDGR